MYDRMQTLTRAELTKIHDAAMEILQHIGVKFDDDEAHDIFKKAGLKVDGKTVFFPEKEIQQAIASAPSHFHLAARNPAKSVAIGEQDFVLAPGYGAPFVITPDGFQREALMADYENFCRLVQTSRVINMNGYLMVMPADVAPATAHLDMLYANIVFCDKPFMGSPVSRSAAQDCLNMAAIVWGGKEKLQQMPVTVSLITPLSPLQYTAEMTGAVIELARYNQACIFGDLILAGSSGPVSLAGVLAQQTAELLAGVALTQLVRPGAPVIVGGTSSIMDMRTGSLAMGAPELTRLTAAMIQIARFYNLPVRAGCALTDAHVPDAQAGFESALGIYTAVRNGTNFILHAAGILGSYEAMSFEKFLIDEELCSLVLECLKPLEITTASIDLDLIKEIGIGGNYLTHPKTLQQCRTAFFLTYLVNRQGYEDWRADGARTVNEKAAAALEERLAAYVKPDIDPQIEKDLAAYVRRRKNAG